MVLVEKMVCEMFVPLPAENPVNNKELGTAVQEKVVPATLDRMFMFVVWPVQRICDAGWK